MKNYLLHIYVQLLHEVKFM